MLIALISGPKYYEALKKAMVLVNGQIVIMQVVQNDHELRTVFSEIKRSYVDAVVIDVTCLSSENVYSEIKNFRLVKEKTRMIVISPGASPGDVLLSKLVSLGIYDIVGIEDEERIIHEVSHMLQSEPKSLAAAWRWFERQDEVRGDRERPEKETTTKSKVLQWTNQFIKAKKESQSEKETEIPEEVTVTRHDEDTLDDKAPKKLIILYSPAPTGKTFVGINLAIAIARTGQKVAYMDCTSTCAVKMHFNSKVFPFKLKSLPLWVSGFTQTLFQEDTVVVLETNTDNYFSLFKNKDNTQVYAVVNSDYAHQIQLAKNLKGKDVVAMIWNEFDKSVNPRDIIALPVITTIPHYPDTNARIKKGMPRALEDNDLCNKLLKIYNFDRVQNFLMGSEDDEDEESNVIEMPAWLRRG